MQTIIRAVSLIALGLILVPCLLYFVGQIGLDGMNWLALAGTILWFIAAPLWMTRNLPADTGGRTTADCDIGSRGRQ